MDRNEEQERRPGSEGDGESVDVTPTPGGFNRRTILGSGLAMAAGAGLLEAGLASPASAHPHGHGRLDTLERVSGHALYHLPEDHKWHTGGIFDSGQVQEWHYWTGFFTDDHTGEQFGIFYNITNNPSAPGGPSLWEQGVSFSFGDFAKQKLVWSHQLTDVGSLQATRPRRSTSKHDFQYHAEGDNVEFTTTYRAEPDTWRFRFTGVAANNGNSPIAMDMVNTTQSPYGYMPVGLAGFENQNIPWNGQNLDPATLYSLSYYYTGPISKSKGTVTIGGRTRHLTGTTWFEHQWGNYNSGQEPWTTAYTWGAVTFNNGNVFTWRQWYGAPNGSAPLQPILEIGRNSFGKPNGTPDGSLTFHMGNNAEWTPLKTWKSPVSGRNIATQVRLTSSFGSWYLTNVFDNYEMPWGYPPYGTNPYSFVEAAMWVRTGSVNGPIVGHAFAEQGNQLTQYQAAVPG